MARNLIGTGADQVSVNGMLGELAFQSKENVNFTGGTGKLSKLALDSINAQIFSTAVDIYVYDTSEDTDGGKWRNRCQHTSWYNEPLNTAVRGSRKEFPSVAVIVATSSTVTIYDADDTSLQMWMVFIKGGPTSQSVFDYSSATSVCMLNGTLCIGTAGSDNSGTLHYNYVQGLNIVSFIADGAYKHKKGIGYGSSARSTWAYGLSKRNLGLFPSTSVDNTAVSNFNSYSIAKIAMSVIPGAPIDPKTNLPVPTIACGTGDVSTPSSGVTVIKDSGAFVTISNSNWTSSQNIYISGSNLFFMQTFYTWLVADITALSGAYTIADRYNTTPIRSIEPSSLFQYEFNKAGTKASGVYNFAYACNNGYLTPTNNYINLVSMNPNNENAMCVFISNKFNTGWMTGNTRGNWLCDSSADVVLSSELLSNGTFDSNVTGWTTPTGTFVSSASAGSLTNSGTTPAYTYTTISTIPGRWYSVIGTITPGSGNPYPRILADNAAYGAGLLSLQSLSPSATNIVYGQFQATASTTYITLTTNSSTSAAACSFDNVSCKICEPDRSLSNKPLTATGSVIKAPVAFESDLMSYGNFSSSNYLETLGNPYDLGSGDFALSFWYKTSLANSDNVLVSYENPTSGNGFIVIANYGGNKILRMYTGRGGSNSNEVNADIDPNVWSMYTLTRVSGIPYLYKNGVLVQTGSGSFSSFATNKIRIGNSISTIIAGGSWAVGDGLALVRLTTTVPSADQILKMFNDEKMMFNDYSKTTIYGSSNYINAMAFDESAKLLHVGTSAGRSVFQGLRRIDNTTTAVTTLISAANGLVAEQ